ncbi:arsenate reductase family protein [Ruminococcaceae bacterium OttesenSCG-928-L11]|nr:arsenate reductase family protein [Ruminococcaceae bacterium OttesenSCG-928-L11]
MKSQKGERNIVYAFICYDNCSTCKKAEQWLESHGIAFTKRPIKEQNPTEEELREWHAKSGLPLRRFFNTSGLIYRELKLKDRLADMPEAEQYPILATDGMLVKRPLLIGDDCVLVGFREAEWAAALTK